MTKGCRGILSLGARVSGRVSKKKDLSPRCLPQTTYVGNSKGFREGRKVEIEESRAAKDKERVNAKFSGNLVSGSKRIHIRGEEAGNLHEKGEKGYLKTPSKKHNRVPPRSKSRSRKAIILLENKEKTQVISRETRQEEFKGRADVLIAYVKKLKSSADKGKRHREPDEEKTKDTCL